jgi:hypothetical protein
MKYKIIFATNWQELGPSTMVEEADHGTIELDEDPTTPEGEEELAEKLEEFFDGEHLKDNIIVEETPWGWEITAEEEDEQISTPLAFICKFPME